MALQGHLEVKVEGEAAKREAAKGEAELGEATKWEPELGEAVSVA